MNERRRMMQSSPKKKKDKKSAPWYYASPDDESESEEEDSDPTEKTRDWLRVQQLKRDAMWAWCSDIRVRTEEELFGTSVESRPCESAIEEPQEEDLLSKFSLPSSNENLFDTAIPFKPKKKSLKKVLYDERSELADVAFARKKWMRSRGYVC